VVASQLEACRHSQTEAEANIATLQVTAGLGASPTRSFVAPPPPHFAVMLRSHRPCLPRAPALLEALHSLPHQRPQAPLCLPRPPLPPMPNAYPPHPLPPVPSCKYRTCSPPTTSAPPPWRLPSSRLTPPPATSAPSSAWGPATSSSPTQTPPGDRSVSCATGCTQGGLRASPHHGTRLQHRRASGSPRLPRRAPPPPPPFRPRRGSRGWSRSGQPPTPLCCSWWR
jgi:hypothetical protein